MERRDFLKASALGVAAVAVTAGVHDAMAAAPPETFDENGVKYRMLGDTGARVSLIGLGGYHLARPGVSAEETTRIVRSAIDRGSATRCATATATAPS